jgi:DNA helicase II / ATP-dependent DNA helicase PcrA
VTISAQDIAGALGLPRPTDEQASIIEHPPTPMLVVAGAGSGKTETMSARVVWLVANGHVEPDRVLGLTFTRKAAAELASRVGARLAALRQAGIWSPTSPEGATDPIAASATVSTYHAYAGRIVSEHALRLGREPEARLLSEAAAWQFANEAVASYDGPLEEIGRAESTITNAVVDLSAEMAEHLVTPDRLAEWLDAFEAGMARIEAGGRELFAESKTMRRDLHGRRMLVPVLEAYERLKVARGALDFADQMSLAARVASRFPVVGQIERARFGAVLLDEFQDTSVAQLELLRALFTESGGGGRAVGGGAGEERAGKDRDGGDGVAGGRVCEGREGATGTHCVTAVGDPNQSIYGWRGASAATLAQFPAAFGAARDAVLPLTQTWRNDARILAAANAVAAPLRREAAVPVAPLTAAPSAAAGRIEVARPETIEDEATQVAHWMAAQLRGGARSGAVLCRKRSQFGPVVEALAQAGLPYEVVGIGGLLTTPEVQDLVALLTVAHDAARGDRLMRLLTGPKARLGAADLDRFYAWARSSQQIQPRREAQRPLQTQSPPQTQRASRTPSAPEVQRLNEDQRRPADLSDGAADRVSLVEALVELDRLVDSARVATGISEAGLTRLHELAEAVGAIRRLSGLGLAELVDEAERALGLDIEVLARPAFGPAAARAHLDAFADIAANFSMSSDRPTLGGFLAWLDAALEEERGLDRGNLEVAPDAVHVLTVHAAKGLEWDAVAVPGLVEATFPVHTATTSTWSAEAERWVVGQPSDGAWTRGIATLPYDLRGDRLALPDLDWRSAPDAKELENRRKRFRSDAGARGIDEERRLAYVALTRARHRLLLTAPVWSTQGSPRVVSRFVTELFDDVPDALARGPWTPEPDPEARNPRLSEPITALWPVQPVIPTPIAAAAAAVSGARTHTADSDPGEVLGDPELAVLLAERRARQQPTSAAAPRAAHHSAADLVAAATDLEAFRLARRRPMPTRPAESTRQGTAFHAWVERHYRRAALLEPDDLPGSADEGGAQSLDDLTATFLASPWAGREPLEVELAVETVIGGVAVRGRIDAVFRDGDGFVIVDWKSGHAPNGADADAKAVQLALYRLAYARLRDVPPSVVRAAFYYAATGESVFPPLPSDAELVELAEHASRE